MIEALKKLPGIILGMIIFTAGGCLAGQATEIESSFHLSSLFYFFGCIVVFYSFIFMSKAAMGKEEWNSIFSWKAIKEKFKN